LKTMAASAKTVIVADGDEKLRKQLFLCLSNKGYDVRTADSASNLMREVERSVGIIVMDVDLPGMKAHEMIPLVKRVNPKLPIVVMSASSSIELAQRIRNAGIFFYAMKPIDVGEIETVIESAFRKLEQETQPWLITDNPED